MNAETWGCLAEPPATATYLRRRALVKRYRRHREEIELNRQIVVLREVQAIQRRRALEKKTN